MREENFVVAIVFQTARNQSRAPCTICDAIIKISNNRRLKAAA